MLPSQSLHNRDVAISWSEPGGHRLEIINIPNTITPNMEVVVQRRGNAPWFGEGRTQSKSPERSSTGIAASGIKKKRPDGCTVTTLSKHCCFVFVFIACLSLLTFNIFMIPPSELNSIHGAAVMDAPTAAAEATAQEGVAPSGSALIFPNVLLIGTQKAGTTAVAHWLSSSPATCTALTFDNEPRWYNKEVHFFNQPERFQHGQEFYARRFEHCTSSKFVIDATPNYAPHAGRIGDFYHQLSGCISSLKVMMILREPVSRELSAYNHRKDKPPGANWSLKKNYTSFDEYVDEELILALTNRPTLPQNFSQWFFSLYAIHLRHWFDVLERDQILILSYHELIRDPMTFQRRIEEFLGLPPSGKLKNVTTKKNVKSFPGKDAVVSCRSRNKLAGIFQPYNENLYALLAQNPGSPMEQNPFPEFEVAACHD